MRSHLGSCSSAGTFILALGLIYPAILVADDVESLKKENVELRQRVDKLSGELDQIRNALATKGIPVDVKPGAKPVTSAFDIKLYGYVKLDAAHDDSRVNVGNFARWVETESVLRNDRHFSLTANQTRLGMDILGPATGLFKTSGKVEIDFYGAGAGENKPDPMLRHAYVNIEHPGARASLLAGQTFDIISPLAPTTVNYSVGWWQGNVGYRRPQLRLTKIFGLTDKVDLKLEGGISRTITGRRFVFKDANDPDTGADAGFPTCAGRISLTFPVGEKRQATVGFSGHYGGEEIHATNLVSSTDFETWSMNVDLRLPLTSWLLLQAEGFIGQNFDSHLGGIGQGINTTTMDEIRTIGGWAALTWMPAAKWQFNLGAGVDDPRDRDLTGSPDPTKDPRSKNWFLFGNCFYSLTPELQLALELAYLRTSYLTLDAGEAWREQFAVIYKF